MTLNEFTLLSSNEQSKALWAATMLGHRENGFFHILLYQLDSFYIEVYYDKPENVLSHFRPFSSTRYLEPYLREIDLTGKF